MKQKDNLRLNSSFAEYAKKTVQNILSEFNTSEQSGLSSAQVTHLHSQYGANALTGHEATLWQILWNQIKSPFIYLLVIIAILNFILGDMLDGLMILTIVIINTAFSFYQEFRTHHALQLLKKYIVDKVRVIRDGKEVEIPTQELVPGDIISLYPGDIIPADVRFMSTQNLTIDEAILTGESAPVQKTIDPLSQSDLTVFNATNIGFSGTNIVSGKGVGIVFAIGNTTYFGSLATQAKEIPKLSSFTLGITRFSRFILYLVLITVTSVFIMHFLLGSTLGIVNLLIFSMALGISIIPEALPIVITFSLARGALRLAKHKVVTKRLSSIEDLGSMDVLCIDKTGTITQNLLTLSGIQGADERKTLFYAVLASGLQPAELEKDKGFNGPLWQKLTDQEKKSYSEHKIIAEHPFEPQTRYSSVVVQHDSTNELIIRGNTQEVLRLCTNLTQENIQSITAWGSQEGQKGHRVLAIAKKEVPANTSISKEVETNAEFIGLVSYEDPLKPTATASLERARKLGITVKVISGDTVEVNTAVAQTIKLISKPDEIISGEEFAKKVILKK